MVVKICAVDEPDGPIVYKMGMSGAAKAEGAQRAGGNIRQGQH